MWRKRVSCKIENLEHDGGIEGKISFPLLSSIKLFSVSISKNVKQLTYKVRQRRNSNKITCLAWFWFGIEKLENLAEGDEVQIQGTHSQMQLPPSWQNTP